MTVTGGIFIVETDGSFSYVGESDKLIIAVGSIDSGNIFYYNQEASLTIDGERTCLRGGNVDMGLFETLANNTKVEWGLATNSQNNDFVLTTSHKYDEVSAMLPDGKGWDTLYHNHTVSSKESNKDLKATTTAPEGYKDYYIYYETDGKYYYY